MIINATPYLTWLSGAQVEWTDNHQQRTLHVRITEELDPFFLFQLTISEEDFQGHILNTLA